MTEPASNLPTNDRQLNGTLQLHDIRDVETHCKVTIDNTLRKWKAHLPPHDYEDLLAYLIETTWELSTRYNPTLAGQHPSFSGYALHITRLRIVDWMRKRHGRSTTDRTTTLISIDEPAQLDARPTTDTDDGHRLRLLDTLPSRNPNPADDRLPDLLGLHNPRNR